ncbi:hypothetical protein [Mycolicibacterium brisbanense]|uniref:Uncharacterized protein n=1 Tax=Mycolicibacterium brisbanense TaxID=146020 RepID=A0A117I469_9MYCO|nr:hypothetical protein [Mycolicibacterium brisbanense]MCV7156567.1 hypothetical protein [Mycolicibacterium brisbanense]GAS86462.1 uncharacterized protein RMCB_0558 [Mycolicibacterium brisbanense]
MSGCARYLGALLATAGMSVAMLTAASANATPKCINTTPTTTQCQTNGSTQIVTTPPATNFSPGWGWGIGLGGFPIVW